MTIYILIHYASRELLEEIKKFEEKEGQHSWAGTIPSPKKRTLAPLAPLTEPEGPLALLQAEIQRLKQENVDLSQRLQSAKGQVRLAAASWLPVIIPCALTVVVIQFAVCNVLSAHGTRYNVRCRAL